MRRLAYVFFPVLLVAVTAYIVATTGSLPERVASHFGPDNFPNGWMPRASYLTLMLLFAVLFPVVLAVVVGFLPRVAAFTINIPNPDYWLTPQRREATLATLARAGMLAGLADLRLRRGCPPRDPRGERRDAAAPFIGAVLAARRRIRGGHRALGRRAVPAVSPRAVAVPGDTAGSARCRLAVPSDHG